MNKRVKFLGLFVFFSAAVFCDTALLLEYQQNFLGTDLPGKVEILKDAAFDENARDIIGQFYEYALLFALSDYETVKDEPDTIKLIDIAVRGLGNAGYSESLDTLWDLFLDYQDTAAAAEILVTIGKLGKGNRSVVGNINYYLLEQNEHYGYGMKVNYTVVSACIAAILELGDSSSYPALFGVLCSGYPEIIVSEAAGALDLIPGDYKQFLCDVIVNNLPGEKFTAFRAGINSETLSSSERGQIAELALEESLASNSTEEGTTISALRYAAVSALTQLRWTRAGALAVRHYYLVQIDFQRGAVSKERFLEAIAFLGAVGNSDAVLALLLQLGLINAQNRRTGLYDAEITLAIVRALGLIGDKAAFDHLTQIGFLNYSENIQAAAREALSRLKW